MTPIPRDPTGSHPLVQWCKQLSRCVRERTVLSYHNGNIDRTEEGVRLKGKPGGGTGATTGGDSVVEIGRFSISQILRSVLLCYQVTSAGTGTTLIPVAKPFELDPERAIGDGALTPVYVYPPSNGTASEIAATYRWRTSQISKESIFPAYGTSGRSIIFAMKGITGGTGVSYNGSSVEWQDMNTDGRIFLTDLNTYTVCVQGAYKTVQIRGTNPNA